MWTESRRLTLVKAKEDCQKASTFTNLGGLWMTKNAQPLHSDRRSHPSSTMLKMDHVDQRHDDKQRLGCEAMVSYTMWGARRDSVVVANQRRAWTDRATFRQIRRKKEKKSKKRKEERIFPPWLPAIFCPTSALNQYCEAKRMILVLFFPFPPM